VLVFCVSERSLASVADRRRPLAACPTLFGVGAHLEDSVTGDRCKARTKSGESCRAQATRNGFCSLHCDPKRAAELGRLSGKSRRSPETGQVVLPPPKSASDLHHALGQIFSEVCSGRMDANLGRSVSYIASVLVRTLELSDHEVRLRALEQMLKSIKSGGNEK